jgi:predicted RNA-binding Zn ribbon-like protein
VQPFIKYGGYMDGSAAPGDLEQVRSFLNSWWIPNDTRQPADDLAELARDRRRWAERLPGVPVPRRSEVATLITLRDQLREALGRDHPTSLQAAVDADQWRIELTAAGVEPAVRVVPRRWTTASAIVAIAIAAVAAGTWARLRACPDCGWVFYDSSRNARRTWCSMTAAGGARGCGSIAKTRAYRARQAAAVSSRVRGAELLNP